MSNLATAELALQQRERQEELDLLAAVLSGDSHASKRFVQRYTPVIEARVRRGDLMRLAPQCLTVEDPGSLVLRKALDL